MAHQITRQLLGLLLVAGSAFGQSALKRDYIDVNDGGFAQADNYLLGGQAVSTKPFWSTYADAAGAAPVDCTGGSPSVTVARNTTSPIGAIADFLFTKDASNRQGQGFSRAFTIDSKAQAQPQQISFDYRATDADWVAGNANDYSSTGDSSITVWVYDVTNGIMIQPVISRLFAANGVNGFYNSTFQPAANSTSYRLCLHVANTTSANWTLQAKGFTVGRATQVGFSGKAPTVTKYLTGSGTYTPPSGLSYIMVRAIGGGGGGGGSASSGGSPSGGTGGTGGTTTFGSTIISCTGGGGGGRLANGSGGTCTLGSGYDGNKADGGRSSDGTFTALALYGIGGMGAPSPFGGGGGARSGASAGTGIDGVANSGAGGGGASSTGAGAGESGTGGAAGGYVDWVIISGDKLAASFSYSIGAGGTAGSAGASGFAGGVGGSGRLEIVEVYIGGSGGAAGRPVYARYTGTTQTLTANTKINFDTKTYDSHNAVTTGGSWAFTAPYGGVYRTNVRFYTTTNVTNYPLLFIDGVNTAYIQYEGSSKNGFGGSIDVLLKAGQTIDVRPENTAGTMGTSNSVNFIEIVCVSCSAGPSGGALQTVTARATLSGNQSISTTSATKVTFNVATFDTSNAFDTTNNRFVCPMSAYYKVSVSAELFNQTINGYEYIRLYKNGAAYSYALSYASNSTGSGGVLADIVKCAAGEYLEIYMETGDSSYGVAGGAGAAFFAIEKVGNL